MGNSKKGTYFIFIKRREKNLSEILEINISDFSKKFKKI